MTAVPGPAHWEPKLEHGLLFEGTLVLQRNNHNPNSPAFFTPRSIKIGFSLGKRHHLSFPHPRSGSLLWLS